MTRRKHLIIGSGTAACSALDEIRRRTSEDEVKLVTVEECPPYSPASLPYLLSGKITENGIWRADISCLSGARTSLATGKEATRIEPEKRRVSYRDGTSEDYDTSRPA
jgi:NADPH-dependent 2,4-dienoyl-CoA reductase/sulfur reductase-like enzyme